MAPVRQKTKPEFFKLEMQEESPHEDGRRDFAAAAGWLGALLLPCWSRSAPAGGPRAVLQGGRGWLPPTGAPHRVHKPVRTPRGGGRKER